MPPLLIPHVEESRLSALQLRLESISQLSIDFLVLLACSTVIATFGLFQNSVAVIIGAMIIAPLMRPLVGLSLSTLTADTRLLTRSLLTLLVGSIMGVGISALMAFCLRSLELTPEILGRTHPTLLDLGVALVAGATGAYCQANENLTNSLAGVAIAVALVPPLSVVGIGFAFNSAPIWMGAVLLYATNLVGITFAGAIVFLVMGFTPLTQAKKGLAISSLIATFLVVPLGFSMRELILENHISATIKTLLKEKTFTFRGAQLHDVKVKRFRTPMSVIATVLSSDETINSHQVRLVQDFLSREMGSPVEFRLRIIPSTELSAGEVSSESPASSIIPASLSHNEAFIAPAQEKLTQIEDQPSLDKARIMNKLGKPVIEETHHTIDNKSANLSTPGHATEVGVSSVDN